MRGRLARGRRAAASLDHDPTPGSTAQAEGMLAQTRANPLIAVRSLALLTTGFEMR